MVKILKLFNIIVAHVPGRNEAMEALRLLRDLIPGIRIFDTPPPLILAYTDNPFDAVFILSRNLNPSSPIIRAIPLDAVTLPYLNEVDEAVKKLVLDKLRRDESFAIKLEGHLYRRDGDSIVRLHKSEAIEYIARDIDNRVDLNNPDKLILIKVVRVSRSLRYAGIMVAPPTAIYAPLSSKWRKPM